MTKKQRIAALEAEVESLKSEVEALRIRLTDLEGRSFILTPSDKRWWIPSEGEQPPTVTLPYITAGVCHSHNTGTWRDLYSREGKHTCAI